MGNRQERGKRLTKVSEGLQKQIPVPDEVFESISCKTEGSGWEGERNIQRTTEQLSWLPSIVCFSCTSPCCFSSTRLVWGGWPVSDEAGC